ncbi:hypothetical protein BofuT4_uP067320.1 [Botrytis cinerea T4]|uniref:Uncharacterized protein n=1 Tax=Botryotinia fuckeliana (strain T4) TaxID=999810 RepID=G2XRF6_BOTF4|nr:hypothetical protein BofuT4_uP067320.1 [Botrytis cinerea T4]
MLNYLCLMLINTPHLRNALLYPRSLGVSNSIHISLTSHQQASKQARKQILI